jgi:hypothetical protein
MTTRNMNSYQNADHNMFAEQRMAPEQDSINGFFSTSYLANNVVCRGDDRSERLVVATVSGKQRDGGSVRDTIDRLHERHGAIAIR